MGREAEGPRMMRMGADREEAAGLRMERIGPNGEVENCRSHQNTVR
jgi:hypothetical protein